MTEPTDQFQSGAVHSPGHWQKINVEFPDGESRSTPPAFSIAYAQLNLAACQAGTMAWHEDVIAAADIIGRLTCLQVRHEAWSAAPKTYEGCVADIRLFVDIGADITRLRTDEHAAGLRSQEIWRSVEAKHSMAAMTVGEQALQLAADVAA